LRQVLGVEAPYCNNIKKKKINNNNTSEIIVTAARATTRQFTSKQLSDEQECFQLYMSEVTE